MKEHNINEPRPQPAKVLVMTVRPAQPPAAERTAPPAGQDDSHMPEEPGYGHGV